MIKYSVYIDSFNIKIENISIRKIYPFICQYKKGVYNDKDEKKKIKPNTLYPLRYENYHFCPMIKNNSLYLSFRGLRSYKGDEVLKHHVLFHLMEHFKDCNILITRLDVCLDFRHKNDNILDYNLFKVKRNTPYTENKNYTHSWNTDYIEANTIKKNNKNYKATTRSYTYAKNEKAEYPYSIIRHEIVFEERYLKKIKCNTIQEFSVENLVQDIKDREYQYSYNENSIDIEYNKVARQIKSFFNSIKTQTLTKRDMKDFKTIKNNIHKRDEVLSLLKKDYSTKEISTKLDIKRAFISSVNKILKQRIKK